MHRVETWSTLQKLLSTSPILPLPHHPSELETLSMQFDRCFDRCIQDLENAPSFATVRQQVADMICGKIVVGEVHIALAFCAQFNLCFACKEHPASRMRHANLRSRAPKRLGCSETQPSIYADSRHQRLGPRASRIQEIALAEDHVQSTFETGRARLSAFAGRGQPRLHGTVCTLRHYLWP